MLGRATAVVRQWLGSLAPRVAVVLGSGAGSLARCVRDAQVLVYGDIPGFPPPQVEGHAGELIAGTLEGVPVIVQCGRFHLYEGHPPDTVALPVRVFAELGVGVAILTNAAGGLAPTRRPPVLMLIADHVNFTFRNPLWGRTLAGEQRFPDLSALYDPELRRLARAAAVERGIALSEGVYAGVTGPNYETPAEIRMLARLGADAVGMSTVPEVIVARARGLRVLGISTITNFAAGISTTALSHADVLAAGKRAANELEGVIRGVVGAL